MAWRGVAWRGMAWRGVAWCGIAWYGVEVQLLGSDSDLDLDIFKETYFKIIQTTAFWL